MKKTMIISTLFAAGVAAYFINRKRTWGREDERRALSTERNKGRHRTNAFNKSNSHASA